MKNCPNCDIKHEKSGTFCSRKCANKRQHSEYTKRKIGNSVKKYCESSEYKEKRTCKDEKISSRVKKLWQSNEYRAKVENALKQIDHNKAWTEEKRKEHSKLVGTIVRGISRSKSNKTELTSMLLLSRRTVTKILARLKASCFSCGWDKTTCDVHHILPVSKGGNDDHSNLTYICPNCHRLVHKGFIDSTSLKTLEQVFGNSWKELYYG